MPRPLRLFLLTLLLLLALSAHAQQALSLDPLGTTPPTGIFGEGTAEIVAYDRATQRLFFVNADAGEVQAFNISDPSNPALDTFDILPFSNFLSISAKVPAAQFKTILENAYSRIATVDFTARRRRVPFR